MLGMHELVMQLSSLLDDESAITVRLALLSLKLCLPSLSLSLHSSLAVKLLLTAIQLKHHSYWLVKVSHFMMIKVKWLGSRVVSMLDSGAEGPVFKLQPQCCRVTVLGKQFTPIVPLFTKQRNW